MNEDTTITTLEIERNFFAAKETVFDALTKPELMNQWFYGMDAGYAKVDQDFRVGGSYTIHMFAPDGGQASCDGGEKHAPHGEYLEIDAPNRLVFTWISESFVDDSRVTIELSECEAGTKLNLKHELPAAAVAPHNEGWNACLNHLAQLMHSL